VVGTAVPGIVLLRVYRDLLEDALAFARTRTVAAEPEAEQRIRAAFEARIPESVPPDLANGLQDPDLRQRLRRRAATELFAVCGQLPLPSGPFAAEAASFASSQGGLVVSA